MSAEPVDLHDDPDAAPTLVRWRRDAAGIARATPPLYAARQERLRAALRLVDPTPLPPDPPSRPRPSSVDEILRLVGMGATLAGIAEVRGCKASSILRRLSAAGEFEVAAVLRKTEGRADRREAARKRRESAGSV